MRIITGSAKGLKLKTPKGQDIRPTADRVKESLFAILGAHVPGARVADLFAGTGNLGLEALSRGAAAAVFVDASPASIALIRDNATRARLCERAEFLRLDAVQAVGRFAASGRTFDLIFCDPPYNKGLAAAILRQIDAGAILAPGGIVAIEHSRHEELPALAALAATRSERYGETVVTFLTHTS